MQKQYKRAAVQNKVTCRQGVKVGRGYNFDGPARDYYIEVCLSGFI